MRIAVCAAQVPFVRGGAEIHVEGLREALCRAGHEAEIVALPFKWYPKTEILKSALAWRLIDITESNGRAIDLVICTKFPTWAVRHPNKIAWIIHQYRQAYDWFGTAMSDVTSSPEDLEVRREIQLIDQRGLGECRARFANSANTAARLKRFNDLDAIPLHVPIQIEGLRPERFDRFILSVSRLDRAKRVDLLIEALAAARTPIDAVIVGDGPERPRLKHLVEASGLSERVRFAGSVPDSELVRLYNSCRAVFYGPLDEDFGLVTVEALTAGKPVITVADSGGVLELVDDCESGLVAGAPEPNEVARCLDRLASDERLARELGERGRERAVDISWERAVDRLLRAAM
jgi:glycosyltransferase involved in cell wall biosynthesis